MIKMNKLTNKSMESDFYLTLYVFLTKEFQLPVKVQHDINIFLGVVVFVSS